jgi:predicted phosphohydrolase
LALYAIGDLHLSFGTDKPMDIFGDGWLDHAERLKAGFSALGPDDVCVICGDVSWGMSLDESLEDFRFIAAQPGRKIILKGTHDYWWNTVAKLKAFFSANGIAGIEILNNNCFFYDGAAICGTRGWTIDPDEADAHDAKITAREAGRLRMSLQAAGGAASKLCFFHYPPRYKGLVCDEIVDVMGEFGVECCWYGHVHGAAHRHAVVGLVEGINYELVSADYVKFVPQLVLP